MNAFLSKFMTYYEIQKLHRDNLSVSQISELLVLNRRTVAKYLAMSEREYEEFLIERSERRKELIPYEAFVKCRLELYPDTSCAQMQDWLKEHYAGFPKVSPKTVFNFVNWVRSKYSLTKASLYRQHHPVEELPYGKQAQVDFGEYNLRSSLGSRLKVFFFTLVLSRSRFKYVWFTEHPFTSELAIKAHEQAFEYLQGIPDEIVYDQDKVFIVSENSGDIILTDRFRAYTGEMKFALHFCRKADPQSKGKIENVVKYVKQNFLYNRTYYNIETLNDEALGWLGRTANGLPHAFTKKEPRSEWHIEQPFLKPYMPHTLKAAVVTYTVRKDNTISYKSNLYSLPLGTYQGRGTLVAVSVNEDELIISAVADERELCRHKIAGGQGIKIMNTDHKRDKSSVINDMINQNCALVDDPIKAKQWMDAIRLAKPRYSRDQLIAIKQVIESTDRLIVNKALDYCIENKIASGIDFKAIVMQFKQARKEKENIKIIQLNPLGGTRPDSAMAQPDKSQIEDYETIFKNNQKQ
jgi:transposase